MSDNIPTPTADTAAEEMRRIAEKTKQRDACLAFWNRVRKELSEGTAELIVSKEVEVELNVQCHTLLKTEKKKVRQYLEYATVDDTFDLSIKLERELRDFSNYSRSNKFRHFFNIGSYKWDYLRASDARILVDAYLNDAILVTANIKEFLVLSFLRRQRGESFV